MEKEILKQRIKEFIYENTSFDEINADDNMDTASDKIADYIINKVLPQAKVMEKEQSFEIFKAGQESMEEGGKGFEQYYNETYEK